MAFADEGFNPSNQSYEFAMCIQVKAEWVLVGVGNDEGNNLPNHLLTTMSWVTLGHGQYMTGHNHVFHHTDAAVNCKTNGMNFIVGDKIQIKYDHLTKVLEFRKESDQTITSMLITDMSKRLYPCVMLYYPGDQVELVQS